MNELSNNQQDGDLHSGQQHSRQQYDPPRNNGQRAGHKHSGHHQHSRHHHRHHKKKLFSSLRRQRHYRKHRNLNRKLISTKSAILACLILLSAAILLFLFKMSSGNQKKIAVAARQVEQRKQSDTDSIEEDIQIRFNTAVAACEEYLPGIVCWGESLTRGSGGDGVTYPDVLADLINTNLPEFDADAIAEKQGEQIVAGGYYKLDPVDVVNMGASDENTITTLGRNGAVPFVLASDVTIPADKEPVEIEMISSSGEAVMPMRYDDAGMEYVVIGGIKGKIDNKFENTDSGKIDHFIFIREQAGGGITLAEGTEIITSGSLEYLNYIPIIFIGQEKSSNVDELIWQQKAILDHQQMNPAITDRYLIIGQPFGKKDEQEQQEDALEQEYGLQYINTREYMSSQGLIDAGLKATEEDKARILNGEIPISFTKDANHLNDTGYQLLAGMIYQRMVMLGYFDEVEASVDEVMQ